MSGRYNGVQAIIRQKFAPHALYVHCAAHSLNLAISVSSKIPAIRDCLDTIEALYNYFNTPKRKDMLQKTISESEETPQKKTLKRLNLTRWISKYQAVEDFEALCPFVFETLGQIRTSESDAKNLKNAMDFEFLISLKVISMVYQLSLPLSREFQRINLDLVQAMDLAKDLRGQLKIKRAEDDSFSKVFEDAKKLAEALDIDVKHKRIVNRQKNRSNPSVKSTEEYFRVTVFNPFLDCFVMDLGKKFTNHENILEGFSVLFKDSSSEIDKAANKFNKTVEFYQTYLTAGSSTVLEELKTWKRYLIRRNNTSKNSLEALDSCPKESFPNIYVLLKILATLPVSTSTPERTFSSLKRIKTIQRSMTNEDRLNGLAALAIHREIPITPDEVISALSKKKRKLDFIL